MSKALVWVRVFLIFALFLNTFVTAILAGMLINDSKDVNDISVALNSDRETSYKSSVPIFGEVKDGYTFICGATIIADGLAITAAHCTEDATSVYIGKNPLTFSKSTSVKVDDVVTKPGFDGFQPDWSLTEVPDDLTMLVFDNSDKQYRDFAKIGKAEIGCNYRMASFGTTSEEVGLEALNLEDPRYKQGIDICIVSRSRGILKIEPESSTGLCHGDSGSPIYNKSTGEIVAVISSVVAYTKEELCSIDNKGLAVELKANNTFLSKFINIDSNNTVATSNDEEFSDEFSSLGSDYENIYAQDNKTNFNKKDFDSVTENEFKRDTNSNGATIDQDELSNEEDALDGITITSDTLLIIFFASIISIIALLVVLLRILIQPKKLA